MSFFVCPVCRTELQINENSFKCKNGHCYDQAKSGYINLLMSQEPKEKRHGDDKLMVSARKSFLEGGFYSPLLEKILEIIEKYAKRNDVILDTGCGECWYTNNIYQCLVKKLIDITVLGIDISKTAIDFASKRNNNIKLAVASVFDIPISDNSCDILISIFAPYSVSECKRLLKKDGILIKVIPLERHLWSLKKEIYPNPYENVTVECEIDGFKLLEKHEIKDIIHLYSNDDIKKLFLMTPYYYKTGKEDQMKIDKIQSLDTEIQFAVLVYQN